MFKDFRCVDYSMNERPFEMYSNEKTSTSTNYIASSDTPAMEAGMMGNYNYGNQMNNMQGMMCQPVYECPVERCVHRNIMYEVPHVCPVNTRIINHHIYRHTYSPCYTCSEENTISNIQEGNCCSFM